MTISSMIYVRYFYIIMINNKCSIYISLIKSFYENNLNIEENSKELANENTDNIQNEWDYYKYHMKFYKALEIYSKILQIIR